MSDLDHATAIVCHQDGLPGCTCGAGGSTPTGMHHDACHLKMAAYGQIPGDAPSVFDASCAPGGMVCSACRTPVESEPCREHQPRAWEAID